MLNLIKKIWIKNRTGFVIVLTALLVLLSLTNFFFIFEVTAQSNDECLWIPEKVNEDSTAVFFDLVKFEGVTWNAGIRDGDQLIAIDGIKVSNTIIASQILDRVQKGDYATYTVKRNGKTFETKVLIKKLINLTGFGFALLGFVWILVGFVVLMAKPDGKIQAMFYKVGVYAVLFSMSALVYRGMMVENPIYQNQIILYGVQILRLIGAAFLPFAFIYFFSQFPKPYRFTQKKWFKIGIILLPSLFIAAFLISTSLLQYNKAVATIVAQIDGAFNKVFIAGFLLGLVLLFVNYMNLKKKEERTPIFIILIANFLGVSAIIYTYTLANAIAGIIFNNPSYYLPIIFIAVIPIAFGYSIFRYSLMDVSDVIRKAIMYGAATLALAAIYFVLIYVVGLGISSAIGTEYQSIIAAVIFVLFALGFQSTKDRFQDVITAKFYPEHFEFQKKLLKFSGDISSIVGLENILGATENLFVDSLRLEHFGLMLKNKNSKFVLIRSHGIYDKQLSISDDPKVSAFISSQISLGKRPVIEWQNFGAVFGKDAELLTDEHIFSVVPLIIQSRLIGLLLFGLKYSGSQFAGKDIELLVSAASQTAISIENARLYESELQKQKLERDLENARKIQENLLPSALPSIKGLELSGKMIPAMHVGGDYYDLIRVGEDKMFAVVGDVSGKGLSASLYMSKLQTMMKLYCTEDKSPKEILSEINKRVYESIERNSFITAVLAFFDTGSGKLRICRAGHVPFILIRNGEFQSYQPSGLGLGLESGEVFDASLQELTLEIKSGDIYFLFSDGLNEAMNSGNELYGIERLKKILINNSNESCDSNLNRILDDLNHFRNGAEQNDDITVVCVKVL